MKVTPLSDAMGTEVTGVDLTQPISAGGRDPLYNAFLDHLLLCVGKQNATDVGTLPNMSTDIDQGD
jgi:hypothetical protein